MLIKSHSRSFSREMTAEEEQYMMHVLSGDPLLKDFLRGQAEFTNPQRRLANLPVCARCERGAFYHKGGVQCASCGHWSPEKTHKLKIHVSGGHYR